jgi:hypothetical protein
LICAQQDIEQSAARQMLERACCLALVLVGVAGDDPAHGRRADHVVSSSTVTWSSGVTANWGDWANWDGGNVGAAETLVIPASSVVTVASAQYSHAHRLTCSSTLRSSSHLCIGPGCDASQFSIAGGDPHITFAHGGKADFRGSHRSYYAFITSPDYQFAPYFQEVDFWVRPTSRDERTHDHHQYQYQTSRALHSPTRAPSRRRSCRRSCACSDCRRPPPSLPRRAAARAPDVRRAVRSTLRRRGRVSSCTAPS